MSPIRIAAALGLLVLSSSAPAQSRVTPDRNNVVSSALAGTWEMDVAVSARLRGSPLPDTTSSAGEPNVSLARRLRFVADTSVAARVPAALFQRMQGAGLGAIYLAGTMTLGGRDYPFVLSSLKGNPHVVFFRERGGDPFGDAESFNVMVARAKEPMDDLLFIGGDFNNQPFSAYKRASVGTPR